MWLEGLLVYHRGDRTYDVTISPAVDVSIPARGVLANTPHTLSVQLRGLGLMRWGDSLPHWRPACRIFSMGRMALGFLPRSANEFLFPIGSRGNPGPMAKYQFLPRRSVSLSAACCQTHTPNHPSPTARNPPTARNNSSDSQKSGSSALSKPSYWLRL